jgi:hypothetical protein
MELEAPPRQSIERAAAVPVERQEAARFAGGCAGDRGNGNSNFFRLDDLLVGNLLIPPTRESGIAAMCLV